MDVSVVHITMVIDGFRGTLRIGLWDPKDSWPLFGL